MAYENEDMQKAIDEMLRGMQYLIDKAVKENSFKSYDGIIVSSASNGKWNIKFNDITHSLPSYGSITPTVGAMVKVLIPQGNLNLAYFI